MKIWKTSTLLFTLSLFTLAFYACTKNQSSESGTARMQIYLTDDPGNYDAVFIDVQDIRINYSSDTASGWQSFSNVARGSYDLLTLVNDKDTLLADAEVKTGRIQQIRLVLGPNNYVIVDGQRHDLQTPSAQQSGLKLNIHQDVNEGVLYKLLMDFDVARSINKTGNGKYILKPVIRTSLEAQGGSIRGYILPSTVQTAVYALKGADTIATTYSLNGGFMIKGLSAGTYNLSFVPSDTVNYQRRTATGVIVNTNTVTTVDTVRLQ